MKRCHSVKLRCVVDDGAGSSFAGITSFKSVAQELFIALKLAVILMNACDLINSFRLVVGIWRTAHRRKVLALYNSATSNIGRLERIFFISVK